MRALTEAEVKLIAGGYNTGGWSTGGGGSSWSSTFTGGTITVTGNPGTGTGGTITVTAPPPSDPGTITVTGWPSGSGSGDPDPQPPENPDDPCSGDTTADYDQSFISQHEGGQRTDGYVPRDNSGSVAGQSGVTVATGVDLGQQSAAGLQGLLASYTATNPDGGNALMAAVTPYLGLHGEAAAQALNTTPLTLTAEQAGVLDNAVAGALHNSVETSFNAASDYNLYDLPAAVQTVILDVAHQYGANLEGRTPSFWSQVTSGNWQGAYNELMNFGDDYTTRRHDEAALLLQAINSGIPGVGECGANH